MKASDLQVSRFRGLNNVEDPMTMGLSWLTQADNVLINSAGKPQRREGHAATPVLAGTNITAAYATRDQQHAYVIDAGALRTLDGTTLGAGLSGRETSWAEVNDLVFLANGVDALVIGADGTVGPLAWPVPVAPTLAAVAGPLPAGLYRACCTFILPDGRETGASDVADILLPEGSALQVSGIQAVYGLSTRTYIAPANSEVFGLAGTTGAAFVWQLPATELGIECRTMNLDPIPAGTDVIQVWGGRLWAALYDPASGTTALFPSEGLGFHLFNLDNGLAVPDRVRMLAPTTGALVIGTERRIYTYTGEGQLLTLAEYGVIPGQPWAFDLTETGAESDRTVVFWSERGMCRAMPFQNLTAGHISVAPGTRAAVAVIARDGEKHSVASLHAGGAAFNPRASRSTL